MDLVKTLQTLLCVYVGAAFVSADQDKKEKFRSYLLNIEESQKLYLEATALNAQLQSSEAAQQARIAELEQQVKVGHYLTVSNRSQCSTHELQSSEVTQQARIATLEKQVKVGYFAYS